MNNKTAEKYKYIECAKRCYNLATQVMYQHDTTSPKKLEDASTAWEEAKRFLDRAMATNNHELVVADLKLSMHESRQCVLALCGKYSLMTEAVKRIMGEANGTAVDNLPGKAVK